MKIYRILKNKLERTIPFDRQPVLQLVKRITHKLPIP